MFIGWNERLPGSSSVVEMAAGDVAEQRAERRRRRRQRYCVALALGSGEATGQQADAGAFDIAFAAGDLAGKAQAGARLQRQRSGRAASAN
jgi:hypothetical protein